MSDDKCFEDGVPIKYRGAGPPESMTLIETAPFSIEIPFDDSFLDSDVPEILYEGGMTLEEKLAELEAHDD